MPTDDWLKDFYNTPVDLCAKLTPYFDEVTSADIHEYFQLHGMYQQPAMCGTELVKNMERSRIWEIVRKEHRMLKTKWKGPDIPIFILPSNPWDDDLLKLTKGRAGLAYTDKLFLFVPETISLNEAKALFIHEYHHVCRLFHTKKKEWEFTLLDSIILEGLAEHAVREELGAASTASWTAYYSDEKLEQIWKRLILPHAKLPKSHPKHDSLLFGQGRYPAMAGYCAGYYAVGKYLQKNALSAVDLFETEAANIANLSN